MVDIGNIMSQYQQFQVGQQQAHEAMAGSFGGQKITVSSPASLVMNSAEEASFAMSEREEARLEERKMKPKGPNTDRLEQVEKYFELMDKQGKRQALDSFVKNLSQKENPNAQSLMKEARNAFSDPADAYAALQYAREQLGGQMGDNLFADAMDFLEDLAGQQIRTGISAGITALEHGIPGEAQSLKELYGDTLSDLGSPMDIYTRIVRDYGEDRFEEALNFLTKTLGNDMAGTSSSTDKVQLEGIARDLGTVRLLHGLNSQCKALIARIEKWHQTSEMDSTQMVSEILRLRDTQYVGPFDIENIADRAGMKKLEDRINFLQDFSKMARELPENLFQDPEGRLNIIDAIQTALDDAIAVENELYE